jgi:hypothetical protein
MGGAGWTRKPCAKQAVSAAVCVPACSCVCACVYLCACVSACVCALHVCMWSCTEWLTSPLVSLCVLTWFIVCYCPVCCDVQQEACPGCEQWLQVSVTFVKWQPLQLLWQRVPGSLQLPPRSSRTMVGIRLSPFSCPQPWEDSFQSKEAFIRALPCCISRGTSCLCLAFQTQS